MDSQGKTSQKGACVHYGVFQVKCGIQFFLRAKPIQHGLLHVECAWVVSVDGWLMQGRKVLMHATRTQHAHNTQLTGLYMLTKGILILPTPSPTLHHYIIYKLPGRTLRHGHSHAGERERPRGGDR